MSGTRLRTCNGVKIASAWGQNPALSYSGDDEALDMGTTVFPLGSNITIDKSVDKSWVTPGGEVVYTYAVQTTAPIPLAGQRERQLLRSRHLPERRRWQ